MQGGAGVFSYTLFQGDPAIGFGRMNGLSRCEPCLHNVDFPKYGSFLGFDFPFFSTIVRFRNRICFPWVFDGFLKKMIPGKNGNGKYP